MDMDFSPADLAFREEVRDFLKQNLPDRLRDGARRKPGVFVEPESVRRTARMNASNLCARNGVFYGSAIARPAAISSGV